MTKRQKYLKAWYQKNRDRLRLKHRQYWLDNKERLRGHAHLAIDQYSKMLADQNGLCASCGNPPPVTKGKDAVLQVDHCHKSNKIRKLLCGPCNRALGQAKECPVRLRKLAEYVEKVCS